MDDGCNNRDDHYNNHQRNELVLGTIGKTWEPEMRDPVGIE